MSEAEKLAREIAADHVRHTPECMAKLFSRMRCSCLREERRWELAAAIQSALDAERARVLEEAAGVCARVQKWCGIEARQMGSGAEDYVVTLGEAEGAWQARKALRALAKEPRP